MGRGKTYEKRVVKKFEKSIKKHFKRNNANNIDAIVGSVRSWLYYKLEKRRYEHCLSAENTARKIARLTGANENKAALAALIHDCAKSLSGRKLIKIMKKQNLQLTPEEKNNPSLLHGPAGAYIARKKLGIKDKEILDAIKYHSRAKNSMNKISKIVFIADEIEPGLRNKTLNRKAMNFIKKKKHLGKAFKLVS